MNAIRTIRSSLFEPSLSKPVLQRRRTVFRCSRPFLVLSLVIVAGLVFSTPGWAERRRHFIRKSSSGRTKENPLQGASSQQKGVDLSFKEFDINDGFIGQKGFARGKFRSKSSSSKSGKFGSGGGMNFKGKTMNSFKSSRSHAVTGTQKLQRLRSSSSEIEQKFKDRNKDFDLDLD